MLVHAYIYLFHWVLSRKSNVYPKLFWRWWLVGDVGISWDKNLAGLIPQLNIAIVTVWVQMAG